MVNFLLLIKNISSYSKKNIDQGDTPLDIYKLCSCIRETFCLSYSIRKENNLYLLFQDQKILIKFNGNRLKFLSSDERSQALLLYKALIKSSEIIEIQNWHKSTPGIFVRKFQDLNDIIELLQLSGMKSVLLVKNFNETDDFGENIEFNMIDDPFNSIYLIPLNDFPYRLMKILKEKAKVKFLKLTKIKSIENIILYINYKIDQIQKNQNHSKK
ncbi:MAG: hypothetical protein ACFE8J_01795 [Candidatus Heimdallarchaeota archaeon]